MDMTGRSKKNQGKEIYDREREREGGEGGLHNKIFNI